MTTTEPKLVAETDLSRAIFYQGETDYCLITFSPRRAHSKWFWAEQFSIKNRVTTLGFVSKHPHWFPTEDTSELIARTLREIPNDLRRVTYGFSMGAYAALKFSRRLEAEASIACSPQFTIDPQKINDRRFARYWSELNNGMEIEAEDLCRNNYVIFDPGYRKDRLNAMLIKQVAPRAVTTLRVMHAEHGSVNLLASSAAMLSFVDHVFKPRNVAKPSMLTVLRKRKRRNPVYFASLARRARKTGRSELAERLLKMGQEQRLARRHRRARKVKAPPKA